MASQQSSIEMSNYPFLDFSSNPDYGSYAYALVGQIILYGRYIDIDVVRLLGFVDEIERILSILSSHHIFTIDEPCYEELIKEFYASFEFHGSYVVFQLGGVMHQMKKMPEFGVILGLWTVEVKMSDIYTTDVQDFTEDISVY